MLVKSEDERNRIMLPRVGDGLPDDLLVAEMNAVEHADGQANLAPAGGKFICGVDEFHSR